MVDPEKVPDNTMSAPEEVEKAPLKATATKGPQAPPGFKIVKVRMPDGSIRTVTRPIEPGQAPAKKGPAGSSAVAAKDGPAKATTTPAEKDEAKPSLEKPSTATTTVKKTTPKDAPIPTKSQLNISGQKPASVAPQKGPVAAPVQPRKRSPRLFFTAFATRAITAVIREPGAIGQHHDEGDAVDNGHDSDGFDDDDDDDATDYDGHGDHDTRHGGANGRPQQLESNAAMAGANGLAAGLSAQQRQPLAYAKTPDGASPNQAKSGVQVSEKAQPQASEKEVGDGLEPRDPETRSLHKANTDWTRYVIWFIMITFPILYIILGILTALLPTKEYQGTYATSLGEAVKVAVSAWPIIFAAIVAQSLRTIASYKVERCIRLMTLEQLMGSNSVASSIRQPFLLKRFDLVTIALLVLWSLSPLATQALQRMSFGAEKYYASNITDKAWGLSETFLGQFFEASTIPPGQTEPVYQDPWGNPKIPIIELLDESKTEADEWIDTSTAQKIADFSSNYGIPLEKPEPEEAELGFNLSSSYLHFDCSPFAQLYPYQFNKTDNLTKLADPTSFDQKTYLKIIPQSATNSGQVIFASSIGGDLVPENGTYNSDLQDIYAYSRCNFTQTFVDSLVYCSIFPPTGQDISSPDYVPGGSSCQVTGMKRTGPTPPNTNMADFTDPFMGTAGPILDSYLYDPSNASGLFTNLDGANILNVTTANFTSRLSLLINTYWQLGFGPTVQDGGLDHISVSLYYGYVVQNTTADEIISQPVYAVSWAWIAVLFICSGVLLVASVAGMLMDARTIAPDMLGFASSLARRSKYVDLPRVNSSMSGAERARTLGDHRVMMQDIKPDALVGRVALGSAHASAKRLEKGRRYC